MKITKSQLKQIIKEELEGMLAKPTDSEKWSTITMGAKVQFPEWEMLSGEGRMERLKTALENDEGLRAAFDEAYEKINNLPLESEYSEGKPITLDFFEKLRGTLQ